MHIAIKIHTANPVDRQPYTRQRSLISFLIRLLNRQRQITLCSSYIIPGENRLQNTRDQHSRQHQNSQKAPEYFPLLSSIFHRSLPPLSFLKAVSFCVFYPCGGQSGKSAESE